jgi:hypothetical protein
MVANQTEISQVQIQRHSLSYAPVVTTLWRGLGATVKTVSRDTVCTASIPSSQQSCLGVGLTSHRGKTILHCEIGNNAWEMGGFRPCFKGIDLLEVLAA